MFKTFVQITPIIILLTLSGCDSNNINDLLDENADPQPNTVDAKGNYTGDVVIDLLNDTPKLSSEKSITSVVLQFIPRDTNGFSLSTDQIVTELQVFDSNGDNIPIESPLTSASSELQFDVNFGLVLDTSYSMVDRGAFAPMLNAASTSIQSGIELWGNKAGDFNFYTSWFNNYVFSSVDTNANKWSAEDILDIPAPEEDSYTKLLSAVDFMVNKLNALPQTDINPNAPSNQNIILVFSDGDDNYSFNSGVEDPFTDYTSNLAEFTRYDYKATALDDLITSLNTSNNLTVHVIGLGDTINQSMLQTIANNGNGTFRKNPDASGLTSVFNSVIQEFTTLQTHGVKLPLQNGDYFLLLRVSNIAGGNVTESRFDFRVDDEGVSVIIPEE